METTDSRNGGGTGGSYVDAERTVHNGRYWSTALNGVTTLFSISLILAAPNISVLFLPLSTTSGNQFYKTFTI
jgi:hypothetical protein